MVMTMVVRAVKKGTTTTIDRVKASREKHDHVEWNGYPTALAV